MGEKFEMQLPFGPPPILTVFTEQLENDYLKSPEKLPLQNKHDFMYWPKTEEFESSYLDFGPAVTTLKVNRDPTTGRLIDFSEIPVDNIGCTARNSYSFTRPPSKITDDIRGSISNYPFWPGGIDPPNFDELSDQNFYIDFENDLLMKAPGLSIGLTFDGSDAGETNIESDESVQNPEIISNGEIWNIASKQNGDVTSKVEAVTDEDDSTIETMLFNYKMKALRIKTPDKNSKTNISISKTRWTEKLNCEEPIPNFKERIYNMAKEYPFELDIFQKQAILKLEAGQHIFVAAHTSAGKTVVAEYAIALSLKHHTKAIYTSPIKALSNQKYRDFQKQFGDVGLITGDYQINATAHCLIMTTEILRSMLFKGSPVIRDLDYVIFDEVHYINDNERGHVWEQALIMLPDNVCIVMLSATVPNTIEFADWVGMTKKRKVYVVATSKRPVPLQHYLFTGVEGKGTNCFLVKKGDGPFLMQGYKEAATHFEKKEVVITDRKEGKFSQKLGNDKTDQRLQAGNNKTGNKQPGKITVKKNLFKPPPHDKHYFMSLLNYLTKSNKMPVVAFILSRKRCDSLAQMLASKDLTSGAKEKSYIHRFFQKNIKHLNIEDQDLPQIKWMNSLLQNGIAVHHSGILPILREIVEILFQDGHIKFLFATETFAMGVNMPARTVVFDSIVKYDGHGTRNLLPAEYIQMAGRAGRRGLDEAGTVIIMCKGDIYPMNDLIDMMEGQPSKLESKFRMTYSMILNTLKVEHLNIENIMSRSFREVPTLKKYDSYDKQLKELEEKFKSMQILPEDVYNKLEDFYKLAIEFIHTWNKLSVLIFSDPGVQKILQPGRVVLLMCENREKKLGLILQNTSKIIEYRVLVLCDPPTVIDKAGNRNEMPEFEETWLKFVPLTGNEIFVPKKNERLHHSVITVNSSNILEITAFFIKTNGTAIVNDWEQRQAVRFRNSEPNKVCSQALSILYEKSLLMKDDIQSNIIPITDLKISQLDRFSDIDTVLHIKESVYSSRSSLDDIPDFDKQLNDFKLTKIENFKKERLENLLSYKNLQTYNEYESKIKVLQELEYIDNENKLSTKGKAACYMSTHELILTELIFQNKLLSDYSSSEIAALLSCLVFNGKCVQPIVHRNLKKGKNMIKKIWNHICDIEQRYQVESDNDPKFDLVQLVYGWANGEPFSKIMENVTDVQEGVIVRCILQLHEILHNVKFVLGNYAADAVLVAKIEDASVRIRRGIVFTESLYTKPMDDQ